MNYEKHEFNFFPTNEEDYIKIKENIGTNGYDKNFPILIFEDKILDGWHRFRACEELGKRPLLIKYEGTRLEALDYSIRANLARRQLNSSQKSALAVEAVPFYLQIEEEIEEEKIKKQKQNANNQYSSSIDKKQEPKKEVKVASSNKLDQGKTERIKTVDRVAKAFGTNNSYVSQSKKLKEENPEEFQQVKEGKITLTKLQAKKKHDQRGSAHAEWKTFASNIFKSITEIKRCNDRFTPKHLSKFIDEDVEKILTVIQSWNPPTKDCPNCEGKGNYLSTGTLLTCDWCEKGKIGDRL